MELLALLASEPHALLISVGLLGLIVGSFLNVVIYRLPIMIERDWRTQCFELFGEKLSTDHNPATTEPPPTFNLIQPRSRCPHCGHWITAWENIPLLSYLWQKGQCTACQQKISWRYPAIELLSAILAMITAWRFGFGWPLLGALVFTWAILASAVIDLETYYLFDDITFPLLWLGIACNMMGWYTDLFSSLIGVMAGYLSLWSVNSLFKIIRHKEGMGAGDFKFLALLGGWMGWQALPMIILLSAFVAVGVQLIIMLIYCSRLLFEFLKSPRPPFDKGGTEGGFSQNMTVGSILHQVLNLKIPYGPYLAGAGWICFVTELTYQDYLRWINPSL